MVTVTFYEEKGVSDERLKFAVVIARADGRWVLCRHRERTTWEFPGGHREAGETICEAARRELWEETGALDFSIWPIGVYSVKGKTIARDSSETEETFGMLFYAEIQSFEPELHSEIECISIVEELPDDWTYPEIQPKLLEYYSRTDFDRSDGTAVKAVRKKAQESR